jgi:hypothetical protein
MDCETDCDATEVGFNGTTASAGLYCFDAFSSREPVPISLENALAVHGRVCPVP